MGRGRKGLIEQSVKKLKKTVQEGSNWWKYYEVPDKNNTEFPSKDFLEALKRMELKEVADILFK